MLMLNVWCFIDDMMAQYNTVSVLKISVIYQRIKINPWGIVIKLYFAIIADILKRQQRILNQNWIVLISLIK